jgi:AraC-like DNA-binding protein
MPRATNSQFGVLGLPPLIELARERGLDGDELLRGVGIAPALLADANASVPVERVHALVMTLLARTADEALGLDAGRHNHPSTFGLLGAVVAVLPTAREVMRLFVEYAHLTYNFFHVELEEHGDYGRLTCVPDGELGPLHRFYLDRVLSFTVETARVLFPETHRAFLRSVDLDYPEPAESARYHALFPGAVRFGAAQASFVVDFTADRPRARVNPLALDQLKEHLRAFAAARRDGDELVDGVRREISMSLTARRALPDLAGVARHLGVAERTLRRKLGAHGTSFRALVEEVLAPLAKRYLLDSALTVADVAERLGFSEPASFARAFRRWTGTTPDAFRVAPRRENAIH